MAERTYDFHKRLGVDMSTAKPKLDGTYYAFCPFCHQKRKREHLRQREFWFSELTGSYKCHNCGEKGRLDSEEYLSYVEKSQQKTKTIAMNNNEINTKTKTKLPQDSPSFHSASLNPCGQTVIDYLQNVRGISLEAIHSLKIGEDIQRFSKLNREATCVVFNYFLDDKLVNQKFRAVDMKDFMQTPGCKTIPYNIDAIRSPLDENGKRQPVYIVEGEMDVAAMLTAGFKRCISIPNGAASNLNWINEFWETHFKGVEKYIIAVDTDKPGNQLAERLIERLGPDRCFRMNFDEFKDANGYLITFGVDDLKRLGENPTPCPMEDATFPADIKDVMDRYFEEGAQKGHTTGWEGPFNPNTKEQDFLSLDDIIQWETKQLCLITGRTGDGKSEFLDELVIRLSFDAEWKAIFYTPENNPTKRHMAKLCEKLTGKEFPKNNSDRYAENSTIMTREEYEQAYRWIADNISYYSPKNDETKVKDLLDKVDHIILRTGAKILVIDPFNYIDKELNSEFELNRRDSQIISEIRNFAIQRDLLVFLVAHPRKVNPDLGGTRRRVEMYDISGTADLVNKADICIVIDRNQKNNMTTVYVDKVRIKDYGDRGKCHFLYNPTNGRFRPCKEIKGDPNDDNPTNPNNSTKYNNEIIGINHDMTNWLGPKTQVGRPISVHRHTQFEPQTTEIEIPF